MRKMVIYTVMLLWISGTGCDLIRIDPNGLDRCTISDGFCIVFGDSLVVTHKQIDCYDFSTHMVYLREPLEFLNDHNWEAANMVFTVYADKDSIYSGVLFPAWASSIPQGPHIDWPSFYPGYVIEINYRILEYFEPDSIPPDPREDTRIVQALEKYDQFHSGLSVSIGIISSPGPEQLSFTFTVENLDPYDYYILSPDKMGKALFHYFTNGLTLYHVNTSFLQHQGDVESPEPWDSWQMEWLELLPAESSKTYQISYEAFDLIPPGHYDVYFFFPGLRHVEHEDLDQPGGRIRLGDIKASTVHTQD